MWIALRNSFLSIVKPTDQDRQQFNVSRGDMLVVRARRYADIQRVFPKVKIFTTPGRDYRYRAFVSRNIVAATVADEVQDIFYTNFKGSLVNDERHAVYQRIWGVMLDFQDGKPPRPLPPQRQFSNWSLPDDDEQPRRFLNVRRYDL